MIIIGIILFVFLVYLILIAPVKNRDIEKYRKAKFAHRGLHDDTRPENSMSAFRAAVEAGYGIELDIRLSKDGELVVFHDDTLDRVVGREGVVRDFTADELGQMPLCTTQDTIPRFKDVLDMVGGRVPLLVEIKEDPRDTAVSSAAAKMLREYKGDYIVESFNPLSLRNFAKELPDIPRGILSFRYCDEEKFRKPLYFLLQCLMLNRLCSPSFIAYNHKNKDAFSLRVARALFGVTTFAWTVTSAEDWEQAEKSGFDGVIFEKFLP